MTRGLVLLALMATWGGCSSDDGGKTDAAPPVDSALPGVDALVPDGPRPYEIGAPGCSGTPSPAWPLECFVSCTAKENCVRVRANCCDCAQGGYNVAINKEHQAIFDQKITCGIKCPSGDLCNKCESGNTRDPLDCVKGKCEFVCR